MKHPRRRRKPAKKLRKPQAETPPAAEPFEKCFNTAINPPTRTFWTPFSHASTELNLLARPDFERVCHAIYQTFYLGALCPHQNPPPVALPPLVTPSPKLRLDLVEGHGLPRPPSRPPTPDISPRSTPLQTTPTTPTSHKPSPRTPNPAFPPEDSPWASFNFSPRQIPFSPKPQKLSIHAKDGMFSQSPLMEIFSAKVPMTPVRARSDSPYVSTRERSVHIHSIAYAQDNGKGPQILCRAIINESYKPDVPDVGRVVPTLTYVGFEYCDHTCLTYVPIKDTRLIYRVSCRKERWFGEEVQMIMRRSVYERIKEMSIRAYLQENPGAKVDCGNIENQGTDVMMYVMVKSNRTVRIELGNRTVYRSLLETLNACKHDILGDGLLHVRFSRTPGRDLVQLRFILFGIQATRTDANKGLRVFDIAENDRKDDKKGKFKN